MEFVQFPLLNYKSLTVDHVPVHRLCVCIQVQTVPQHTLGSESVVQEKDAQHRATSSWFD